MKLFQSYLKDSNSIEKIILDRFYLKTKKKSQNLNQVHADLNKNKNIKI